MALPSSPSMPDALPTIRATGGGQLRRDRSGRSAYNRGGSAGPPPDGSHEPLALATVLWDWDGNIPNFGASGQPVKQGNKVYICHVVDANWYQVLGQCKYIPRAFVEVDGVYKEQYRSLFRVPAKQGENPPDAQFPSPPPQPRTPLLKQVLFALCCGYNPEKPSKGPSPEIPSPPSSTGDHVHYSQEALEVGVSPSFTTSSSQEKRPDIQPNKGCCPGVSLSWANIRRRWTRGLKREA